MTETEGRALARTTAVLLVAATVRWGASLRSAPALIPPDSARDLRGLLEESEADRDEAARRGAPLAEGERLDPNRASEVDLDRLPGVGPATARAIVTAREENGPFRRPEDLLSVPGIGPATLGRMAAHLDFSRAPPAASGGLAEPGVDLNRATLQELEGLPGIGPALAGRIVEERERRGGFAAVDDLVAVRGIGPATLERLRPLVVVR